MSEFTSKYADAVEHVLREGEPFFLVRAQDKFSRAAVRGYAQALYAAFLDCDDPEMADHLGKQLHRVNEVLEGFAEWQESNEDLLKIPD